MNPKTDFVEISFQQTLSAITVFSEKSLANIPCSILGFPFERQKPNLSTNPPQEIEE